ncbi:ARM repeat-containing protein [Parathielavia hyrcaniae]|uniref:ARM repeat-containing protein n=1 Tax=Parathielavia hyrcaniae TaxID=113614 RepID=A0AAN6T186_9PEZI|nr:ARM repeat-containing protein [Parathielavia hyrcaniae]
MAAPTSPPPGAAPLGRQDQTMLLFARLMEGGKEDEETVADLGTLTRLLDGDVELSKKGDSSITTIIDADCVDTIACYLDMRQPDIVRAHATLCTSAYLKAAADDGRKKLSEFFFSRVRRGTYDDYIVAFCVASTIFPLVPDLTSELFLREGFLCTLGPLMRRKWKSRKVETACLEMLNAACMHAQCREAVQKYCVDWLEEIVDQDPDSEAAMKAIHSADPDLHQQEGSISMRRHSQHVQNLAAVVLAKLRAVPMQPAGSQSNQDPELRIQPATTSIEDLSRRFTKMLVEDPEHAASSVEGLAYATIQSKVKEGLAQDKESLKRLVKTLETAPPKSPLTYGALSIFVNLTRYQPAEFEEQKRLRQLKAYASAAGKLQPDPLNDDAHVAERCKRVFEAGITPVLVTHSKQGSAASLSLIISIIYALSMTPALRGQLAQQGAVRLLIAAWTALPEKEDKTRRTAAQALARILISTDPALVFRQTPQNSAIRPLASIVAPDPNAETRDLLPTFESLLALTNLASTDDVARAAIARAAWDDIEELLFSSNPRVCTAAMELVCNLVQSAEQAAALFGDGTPRAETRTKVVLALADADAEDVKTRSAAGGALASLTAAVDHPAVVRGIVAHARGAAIVLGLCRDDESEGLRHRGAVVVQNMICHGGEVGERARETLLAAGAVEALTECAKKSRSAEVVQAVVGALEVLLGGE